MRDWMPVFLFCLAIGTGSGPATAEEPETPQEAVDDALAGRATSGPPASASPCAILQPIVSELYDLGEEPTVRETTLSGNHLCRILWEIPGIDTQERTRRALDRDLRASNEISLTIMGRSYGSAEEAVVSLQNDVASLTEGVSVTVAGRERTIQKDFGDWIDGLGDGAIPTESSVLVAAKGIRFTVAASLTDDAPEDLDRALEVARHVVDSL